MSVPIRPGARVLLVRHCAAAHQAPDAPLTARGVAQADALAEHLAAHGVDGIVCSPWRRARETIEPFARRTGIRIRCDDRLVEKTLAAADLADWRREVERSFTDLDRLLPGGESSRAAQARGRAALDAVLRAGHAMPVVVTHGQLMGLVLNSIDPAFGFAAWAALTNPDVFEVRIDSGGALRYRRVWSE